ncbi:MAG TPA: DNA primase, partial [Patescibacteria group bacterium]|nr:DNA primase [Patescibacteria group bacterium]
LRLLADKAGVQLPEYRGAGGPGKDERDLLLRINDFAARYYHQVLLKPAGRAALSYLKSRGLSEPTLQRWQIGYAPDDFHALERALVQKQVSLAELVKAGVSAKNERGQMYDRFRGRVTFPIYDYFGNTVGFSARVLQDSQQAAKYVNSPETAIYNKSKILFGLNFAKEAIRKSDEAVLVEGQMDCIQAHQAGFANTVAVSGTALTELHLQQLARLTKNLKFCFDADSAGQAASRRAGELALAQGFRLKVVVIAGAKDPDELIRKSPGLWAKAVSEAFWFLDFYLDQAETNFPAGSVEQKHYLSREVLPFLGYIQDPLEQDHYIHKLADRFLISEKVIREEIRKQKAPAPAGRPEQSAPAGRPGLLLQKELLGGLLAVPEFAAETGSQLEAADFTDPEIRGLAEARLQGRAADPDSPVAKEAQFMVESQLEELSGDREKLLKSLQKSFSLFKLNALKRSQQELVAAIQAAEIRKDRALVDQLNKQFAQTSARRRELERL